MSSLRPCEEDSDTDSAGTFDRAGTPDVVVLEYTDMSISTEQGGFNLADELAMAEDGEEGLLGAPKRDSGTYHSDYEGSEYGDIDDDSDGYLSDHVEPHELQLQELAREYIPQNAQHGVIASFISKLRGMRGQMDVENNVRRYLSCTVV
jgi:hypothetical protein